MYHQLCVLGVPLGGERKVNRVPANFSVSQRQAGVSYCRVESDGEDRSAVSAVQAVAGSNGGAVCMCRLTIGRLLSARPFYSLLPQLMGNGREQPKDGQVCRMAYRANQLRHCCFTRTETRANVLESLADRSLVPA